MLALVLATRDGSQTGHSSGNKSVGLQILVRGARTARSPLRFAGDVLRGEGVEGATEIEELAGGIMRRSLSGRLRPVVRIILTGRL